MLKQYKEESQILEDKPNFVFGNGEGQTAVGTQESTIFVAGAH